MDTIFKESRRYGISKNPESAFNFSQTELMRYLGICVVSSIVNMANVRMYWSQVIWLDMVRNAMSQKHLEKFVLTYILMIIL